MAKKRNFSLQRGFTLIELLVVISIIGFLASVVMVNVSTARARARNTRRLVDYKKTAEAFEAYRNDNGTYPPSYNSNWSCLGPATSTCYNYYSSYYFYGNGSVYNALVPSYLQSMPKTNITSGYGLNHPFYRDYAYSGNSRLMMMYTFYEGKAPNSCPPLFPVATTYQPSVWETGYYVCFYFVNY